MRTWSPRHKSIRIIFVFDVWVESRWWHISSFLAIAMSCSSESSSHVARDSSIWSHSIVSASENDLLSPLSDCTWSNKNLTSSTGSGFSGTKFTSSNFFQAFTSVLFFSVLQASAIVLQQSNISVEFLIFSTFPGCDWRQKFSPVPIFEDGLVDPSTFLTLINHWKISHIFETARLLWYPYDQEFDFVTPSCIGTCHHCHSMLGIVSSSCLGLLPFCECPSW